MRRVKLLALILAVALFVGLLAAARLAEQQNRIDPPTTENTRPPETTAPQATLPDYTWAATPWG